MSSFRRKISGSSFKADDQERRSRKRSKTQPPISEEERLRAEKLKEEQKKTEILRKLKIKLQSLYSEIAQIQYPWLEKPFTVDNDFIDLCLVKHDSAPYQKSEQTITQSDVISLIMEKKDSFSSGIIYIEGKAGVGKSTLALKIAQKWANGDKELGYFDFTFLIPLRKVTKDSIQAMVSLLFADGIDASSDDILKAMENCKLMFILDGYDEIPFTCNRRATKFLRELQQNPKCTVILTSKPKEIPEHLKINFSKIGLKGLSDSTQIELFKTYFGAENLPDLDKLLKLIKDQVNICQLCRCPSMFLLLCSFIRSQPENYEIPQTLTTLYKHLVNFIVQRYFVKIADKKIEKVDLFETTLTDKSLKSLSESFYKFGKIVLEHQSENKYTFTVKRLNEDCADIFLKVGFLNKIRAEEKVVEPFHRSILEFFCGFYLSKVFFKDKYKFKKCLRQVLYCTEKEDSFIVPFATGFLEKKSKSVIGMIPRWFYYGNVSNLITLVQECHMFVEDKRRLKGLNPTVLCLDVAIQKEILILNSSVNKNLYQEVPKTNLPFFDKKQWLGCEIEVLHELPENQKANRFCDVLKKDTFSAILLNFPCQNPNNECQCNQKFFTESQLNNLMQQIIEKKPTSLGISFPHSKQSFCLMLHYLSRSMLQLIGLSLHSNNFTSEDIKKTAKVLLHQGVSELTFICEESEDFAEELLIPREQNNNNVQFNPIIEAIMDPDCQMKSLKLFDINIVKEEFDLLIYSVSISNTLKELTISNSSLSDNIIDLSQLCVLGQRSWDSVDLKNVRVSQSQECLIHIDTFSIIKCVFEDDVLGIFPQCEIKRLICDCQLLKTVCQPENINFPFYDVLEYVIIEDEIFTLTSFSLLKLRNLSCLSLDLREGFQCDKISEEMLTYFLVETKFLYCLSFYLTFDMEDYFDQIDFISQCFKASNELLEVKQRNRIQVLNLYFGSEDKGSNIFNARSLKEKESQQLLHHIAKLKPFITNGFAKRLMIVIRQSNQKGHFLGPFLKIDEYFPEEVFKVDCKYHAGSCEAKWTIQSWKAKSVNIDLQKFLKALQYSLENDGRSTEIENIDLQIFLRVLKSFLEHKLRDIEAADVDLEDLLVDLKSFLEMKIRATEGVWEKILDVLLYFLEKKLREKKRKEKKEMMKRCILQ